MLTYSDPQNRIFIGWAVLTRLDCFHGLIHRQATVDAVLGPYNTDYIEYPQSVRLTQRTGHWATYHNSDKFSYSVWSVWRWKRDGTTSSIAQLFVSYAHEIDFTRTKRTLQPWYLLDCTWYRILCRIRSLWDQTPFFCITKPCEHCCMASRSKVEYLRAVFLAPVTAFTPFACHVSRPARKINKIIATRAKLKAGVYD